MWLDKRKRLLGVTSVGVGGGTLFVEDKIAPTSKAGSSLIVMQRGRTLITLTGFGRGRRPPSSFRRLTAVHTAERRMNTSNVSLLFPS